MSTVYKKEFSYTDNAMSGTTSGWYEIEYEITELVFKYRARMHLQGNWSGSGTENRYAMSLKVKGNEIFGNYTMKSVSQDSYNGMDTTTDWSEWNTITLTEGTTSVYVECSVTNTGYNTGWSNHQSGWPQYPDSTITFSAVSSGGKISTKVSGAWKKGNAYIKVGESWKQAKKVYTKINGYWIESK